MYNMYKPLCERETYIQSPMEYGQFTFDIYRTSDLNSPCRYNGPFLKTHFKKIKRSASPLSSNLFDFSVTCYLSLLVVTEYTKIKIPSSLLNSDSSLWYILFPFQTERFKCCHSCWIICRNFLLLSFDWYTNNMLRNPISLLMHLPQKDPWKKAGSGQRIAPAVRLCSLHDIRWVLWGCCLYPSAPCSLKDDFNH